jgi:phosphoribosylformylglycinamidine cyclo-ligase
MADKMTYADAGVDIDSENEVIDAVVSGIKRTLAFRKGKVGESITDIGHFSGIVKLDEKKALALASDGVGTKILVASMLSKYDTIGIDLIAMNANDIICSGAEPVTMMDYIAVEKHDPAVTSEIAKGLTAGAEMAGISISGGELATLPEVIKDIDLAGFMIGIVDIDKIITGKDIKPGDGVVGLESSGIHSNGLTLARKALFGKFEPHDRIFQGKSVAEELLVPTKIYVKEILELIDKVKVKGLANITGGGLSNLSRLTEYGFYIDDLPNPQEVFAEIQKAGNVDEKEMYRTFNMGVGFCVVVDGNDIDAVIEICKKHGTKAFKIGEVVEEEGVNVNGKFILKY